MPGVNEMAEKSFDEFLKEGAPDLHKCLEDIRDRAQDDWVHLPKPDHGSHSGLIHPRNVERNADKMIPEDQKKQFSSGEIFLLLASVLLHDLGRIIPDQSILDRGFKEPCPLYRDKDGTHLPCTVAERCFGEQKTHACRTKFLIDEYWANFGLPDKQLATLCGVIAFCHQLDEPPRERDTGNPCFGIQWSSGRLADTSLEPYGRIRVKLL